VNGNGDARPSKPPLWATLIMALGWVVAVASVAAGVASGFKLAASLTAPTHAENIAVVATALAIGVIGFGIGMVLVTVARVGRPASRTSRLAVWAKLCIIVGLELCAGVPLLLYGVMLLGLAFGHDPTAEPIDPWGSDVLLMAGSLIAIPFLIGLLAIASAWIWGRRKSVNVAEVFS
jgi:hypothetical protein